MTRQEFDKELQELSNDVMMAGRDRDKKQKLYRDAEEDYIAAKDKFVLLYVKWEDMVERLRTEKFDD